MVYGERSTAAPTAPSRHNALPRYRATCRRLRCRVTFHATHQGIGETLIGDAQLTQALVLFLHGDRDNEAFYFKEYLDDKHMLEHARFWASCALERHYTSEARLELARARARALLGKCSGRRMAYHPRSAQVSLCYTRV